MEAVSRHDFIPKDDGELPFSKGDTLCITNYGDPVGWYDAHIGTKKGIVPGNYLEIKKANWYMGRIPRSIAEQILKYDPRDGAFLVRLSESSPSDFSLSVKCADTVQHFRVLKDPETNKYFLWTSKFDSINKLVDYYRETPISKTSAVKLRMNEDETFIAEAKYDFEPQDSNEGETELGFKMGDKVVVFDTRDDNWWGGRIDDRTGYFPREYVEKIHGSVVGPCIRQ